MTAKMVLLLAGLTLAACASGAGDGASTAPAAAQPVSPAASAVVAPPAPSAAAPSAPPAPAPAPVAAPAPPASSGAATFQRVCSTCHVPELAADRRMDRAGWDMLVRDMIARGGVATEAETQQIVNYLHATYPAP